MKKHFCYLIFIFVFLFSFTTSVEAIGITVDSTPLKETCHYESDSGVAFIQIFDDNSVKGFVKKYKGKFKHPSEYNLNLGAFSSIIEPPSTDIDPNLSECPSDIYIYSESGLSYKIYIGQQSYLENIAQNNDDFEKLDKKIQEDKQAGYNHFLTKTDGRALSCSYDLLWQHGTYNASLTLTFTLYKEGSLVSNYQNYEKITFNEETNTTTFKFSFMEKYLEALYKDGKFLSKKCPNITFAVMPGESNIVTKPDEIPFIDDKSHLLVDYFNAQAKLEEAGYKQVKSVPGDMKVFDNSIVFEDEEEPPKFEDQGNDEPLICSDLFDNNFGKMLKQVLSIVRFAVPIIIIGLSVMDFIKAMSTQAQEEMKKAINKLIRRIIIGVIIFLLPTILNFVLNLAGLEGTCGIQ